MTPLAGVVSVVVTGALGAGKTTLIGRLLRAAPADARQAVLLNERGAAAIAAAPGVTVAEVDPGCICCTSVVSMRVALTRLLREARPQRLYVELAEGTHLRDALRTLGSPWLAPVLGRIAVIGVLDGRGTAREADPAAWLAMLSALVVRGVDAGAIGAARAGLAVLPFDAPPAAILSAARS